MIGKIKGMVSEIEGNVGLIETASGVYYQVYLTSSLMRSARLDQSIEMYTYLQVREDALILFGFETKQEYELYKMLISVSGVGPKTAHGLISFSNADDLVTAIKENNVDYVSRIPGLGKKTAMKIILELSDKLKSGFKLDMMTVSDDDRTVVEALLALGFGSQEARLALSKVSKDLSMENKIKESIKLLTNHSK